MIAKRALWILAAVAALATIAPSCKKKEEKKQRGTRACDVMVAQPTSRKLTSTYSATIQGKQDIDIRSKVSGYITDIYVKEGNIVSKGQTLFVVDQAPYQAELQTASAKVDVAQAAVDAAELSVTSKERLYEQNIISEFDLRMARTTLASAKAQLAQARADEINAQNNLSYTLVKSPVDGVLGTLPFRVGTLVSPNDATPLTSVSDNSEMYIYFSMTEAQALSLKRQFGSIDNALQQMPSIGLQLNDGTIYTEEGRIESISGIIDPMTGTVTARAKFPNKKRLLISGGTGSVILPHDKTNSIVIPQSATFKVQDKVFAYKVKSGKAASQAISVFEISNGKEYIVETGIEVGDTIVVEGAGLLRDGAKVQIKDFVVNE